MCLLTMEDTNKKPQNFDKNILELFWNLANKNSSLRVNTCLSILRALHKKHNKDKNNEDIPNDLKYCVERLVKGLGSPRDAARLGFALLLTVLLKQYTMIMIEDVFDLIKKHLSFTPKQEKREIVFGQLFAFSSIIRSGRLASHSHLSFVILAIYDLWQGRNYILNAAYEILKDLFAQLSSEKFIESVWPHLKKKFPVVWENCSADTLWFLLLCIRLFPEAVSEKYLKKISNSTDIFSSDNIQQLKKFIRQTTSCLPKLHPLCSEIAVLCLNHKDRKEIWREIVDDNLFEGDQSEKSFIGLEMVKCFLQTTKNKKAIKCVLSQKFSLVFARNFINMKSPMNPAVSQLAKYLSKYGIEITDPDIQMLILKFFLQTPGAISLDQMLRKEEVSLLIQNLQPETVKMYCEFLKIIAFKKKHEKDKSNDDIPDSKRFVAIAQIGSLVCHPKVTADIEWRLSIIKFLFLNSFFAIEESTPDILHCEQLSGAISKSLRDSFIDSFYKSLTSLYQRIEQYSTPTHSSLQCFLLLIEYADQLMAASKNLSPQFPLEKVQESWLQMKNIVHKLRKQDKKDGKHDESNSFLVLFLGLGFQLFLDSEHISEVLEELHICCKKALSDRKHADKQPVDTDEPQWVCVVTDIMLSLLSKNSHHLRRLVASVFQQLCPFITNEALEQILSVINPEKASDEPMLVDESDNEVDLKFDSGSSSDESESNEKQDSKVDEKFKQQVKNALGSAADASDAESIVLSDSEMFQLDDALSKAFRDRVQTGHTQMTSEDKTLLNFRLRCFDLIGTYLKSDPPMYLVLQCIEPLLAAYEFSHKNEHQKHLLHKVVTTIDAIPKIKKFKHLENVEKSDLKKLLEKLLEKCHKEVNMTVANKLYSLCVFVVLCFRRLESQRSPVKKSSKYPAYLKMYLSELEKFSKGSSNIFPRFFVSLMESCPDLAWEIIEPCKNYAFSNDTRIYKRTQCLGILFEAIKFAKGQKHINSDQWLDLGSAIIPVAVENLKQALQDSDIKAVYTTELLDVIYRIHLIIKEKANESILENFTDLLDILSTLPKIQATRLTKKGRDVRKKIVRSLGGKIEHNKEKKEIIHSSFEGSEEKVKPKASNDFKLSSEDTDINTSGDLENLNNSSKKRKSSSKENKRKKYKSETIETTD